MSVSLAQATVQYGVPSPVHPAYAGLMVQALSGVKVSPAPASTSVTPPSLKQLAFVLTLVLRMPKALPAASAPASWSAQQCQNYIKQLRNHQSLLGTRNNTAQAPNWLQARSLAIHAQLNGLAGSPALPANPTVGALHNFIIAAAQFQPQAIVSAFHALHAANAPAAQPAA